MIIGTLNLSAQDESCSIAAALKVSPAPKTTDFPPSLYFLASFAIVVVFPAPLTPIISCTNGLGRFSKSTSGACSKSITSLCLNCFLVISSGSPSIAFSIIEYSISASIKSSSISSKSIFSLLLGTTVFILSKVFDKALEKKPLFSSTCSSSFSLFLLFKNPNIILWPFLYLFPSSLQEQYQHIFE